PFSLHPQKNRRRTQALIMLRLTRRMLSLPPERGGRAPPLPFRRGEGWGGVGVRGPLLWGFRGCYALAFYQGLAAACFWCCRQSASVASTRIASRSLASIRITSGLVRAHSHPFALIRINSH